MNIIDYWKCIFFEYSEINHENILLLFMPNDEISKKLSSNLGYSKFVTKERNTSY